MARGLLLSSRVPGGTAHPPFEPGKGCPVAATKKATTAKAKKSGGKAKKDSRCWAGYEPTPGKKPGTKGSCKPKD